MKNKVYVTTPIFYVNDRPHIGHAFTLLQADAYARWQRLQGNDVYFLTGTDENAIKVAEAAEKNGKPIQEFIDEKAGNFRTLKDTLNLSYNDFIRTSEERHTEGVKKFWETVAKNDNFYTKSYTGLYCVGCERFYEAAELDADGNCPDHKKPPEHVQEENYFFRLSRYQHELEEIFVKDLISIIPAKRKHEAETFIKEGLQDFSVSRLASRMKNWGIDVPDDPNQKIYVWFDALTNYINAIGYVDDSEKFKKYWENSDQIVHFIGKDISRFHTIYWPAMLLAAKLRLPTKIFIHGFIAVEHQKMSKTIGNVVYPEVLVEKYGIDAVRYFLLREFSSTEDGDFSEEKFISRYNGDLANGLGNLVSRVATLAAKIPSFALEPSSVFIDKIREIYKDYDAAFNNFNFNIALEKIWEILRAGDIYINKQKPWTIEDKKKLAEILSEPIQLILHSAWFLKPFLPETSDKIFAIFDAPHDKLDDWNAKELKVKVAQPLFPRK